MLITELNTPEGFISVKSLAEASREWASFDHVLTIEDVGFENGLRIPANAKTQQSVIQFDDTDIENGRSRAATREEVRALLLEARKHVRAKLLIHCLQGQSRSAAIALGVISDRIGAGKETEAVGILLRIRPTAVCNRLVVRYADDLLRRQGKLLAAWDKHLELDDKAAGVMLLRGLAERQAAN